MREAGKATSQILKELNDVIKPGITTMDIDRYVAGHVHNGGGYTGSNECFFCDFFRSVQDIPLIGAIVKWIHGLVHSTSTASNID